MLSKEKDCWILVKELFKVKNKEHFNVPCYLLYPSVEGALNGIPSEGCQYKRKQYGFSSQRIMYVLTLPVAPWGIGISICFHFANLRASPGLWWHPGQCLSKIFLGKCIRCCSPSQKVMVGVRNILNKFKKEESWEEKYLENKDFEKLPWIPNTLEIYMNA